MERTSFARRAGGMLACLLLAGCISSSGDCTLYPVYSNTKSWFVLGPYATSRERDYWMLLPLAYSDRRYAREWYLGGLTGSWCSDDYKVTKWMLPVFLKTEDGFYTLPMSRKWDGPCKEDYYLAGVCGYGREGDKYRRSWLVPFYYHDAELFFTPLYGESPSGSWLFPFYWHDGETIHTPLCSWWDDPKSSRFGWVALAGLACDRMNSSGTWRQNWLFPIWHHESRDAFCETEQLIDEPYLKSSAMEEIAGRRSYDLRTCLALLDWDEVLMTRTNALNQCEITCKKKFGNRLLSHFETRRSVAFSPTTGERVSDRIETEWSALALFYQAERTVDRMTWAESTTHRLFWFLPVWWSDNNENCLP